MSDNRLAIPPNVTHYEMGLAPQYGRDGAAVPRRLRQDQDLEQETKENEAI